jgi:xylan 1,4-beta-xylosidase
MVWNLADVQQAEGIPGRSTTRTVSGEPKTIEVSFKGASAGRAVAISYVDMERGSPFPKWRALGSPQYPTPAQIQMIRAAAELAPPEKRRLSSRGTLSLQLPAEGVALIELT